MATVGGTRRGEERRWPLAEAQEARREEVLAEAAAAARVRGPRTHVRAARPGEEAEPHAEEAAAGPGRRRHKAEARREAAAAAALERRAGLQRRAARRAVPHPRP